MIAALRKSAKRLRAILEDEPIRTDNPLEFGRTSIPETFIERLITHYRRPFDGTYVKAFEFPVGDTPCFGALIAIARENGYHVTHPEDGLAIFASSVDEVEQLLCNEPETPNWNELIW